jgi:hypothetical protein
MIDFNEVLQWKQEFGDIYQVQVEEHQFIFRPIGREEYKQIVLMDLELGEFQEVICFQSTLYPSDYDYTVGIGGIAEVLSDAILDASGLHVGQAKSLLSDFREDMYSYDYQVDCMIHEAFPEYTLEEISTWPLRKTMFYLSRAEWVLQNLKGIPIKLIDEQIQEDVEMQNQQEQQQPPQPEQPPQPYKREIRSELVEAPEPKEAPKQEPQLSESDMQNEAAVLAMLEAAGTKVSKPITDLENEQKPELNWFGYMDELKGEFD